MSINQGVTSFRVGSYVFRVANPTSSGQHFAPFICAPVNSLVRSGANLSRAGEISEAFKVTHPHLTCQYSCLLLVRGSAGDK